MRIAIVGLGIAGLRAAMLLEERGHEITLIEKQKYAGGRMHTAPDGFETGAEWIDADHYRCLNLLDELGLNAIRARIDPYLICYGSERILSTELWPDAAEDMSRVHALESDLDEGALSDYLDKRCQTDRGRWWVESQIRSDEAEDSSELSLREWLRYQRMHSKRPQNAASALRFPPSASIVSAMLSRITAEPIYDASFLGCLCKSEGIELKFAAGEPLEGFDRVILAITPLDLLGTFVRPEPMPEYKGFLACIGMARILKVCVTFTAPFWSDEGWHGNFFSNGLLQQGWNASSEGKHRINLYICGKEAHDLMGEKNLGPLVVDEINKLFPRAKPTSVAAKFWLLSNGLGRGFSYVAPSNCTGRDLARLAGPVHFIGEHTAEEWPGFVEGALESSERVVSQICG
jgi:monoamine oxidase